MSRYIIGHVSGWDFISTFLLLFFTKISSNQTQSVRHTMLKDEMNYDVKLVRYSEHYSTTNPE